MVFYSKNLFFDHFSVSGVTDFALIIHQQATGDWERVVTRMNFACGVGVSPARGKGLDVHPTRVDNLFVGNPLVCSKRFIAFLGLKS